MTTLPQVVGRLKTKNSRVATSYPETLSLSDICSRVTVTDLATLVEGYAGSGRKSGRSHSFECCLPSHPRREGRRTPSLVVTVSKTSKPYWNCYGACNAHGDALDFIEAMEGLTKGQAVERLKSFLGLPEGYTPAHKPTPKPARVTTPTPPSPLKPALADSKKPSDLLSKLVLEEYLAGRSWPLSVVKSFGLEVVEARGTLWIRHPFHDYTSDGSLSVVAYQDRLPVGVPEGLALARGWSKWSERGAKWLTSAGASVPLYNIQALEADELEGVVLCEGPADTITASLALEDYPSWVAVGIAGAGNFRQEWRNLLEGLSVVVAFDNDEAGNRGAISVADTLARPVIRKRPQAHDITDEARLVGLQPLGVWLTSRATLPAIREGSPTEFPSCWVCSKPQETLRGLCSACSAWELYTTWKACSKCGERALTDVGGSCFMSFECSGHFEEVKS